MLALSRVMGELSSTLEPPTYSVAARSVTALLSVMGPDLPPESPLLVRSAALASVLMVQYDAV